MTSRKREKPQFERDEGVAGMEEEQHREFLLSALRAASLRAKLMDADLTTIGIALKNNLIGADTAVAWVKDAQLLGMVGAIPEQVGRVARTEAPAVEQQDQPVAAEGEF